MLSEASRNVVARAKYARAKYPESEATQAPPPAPRLTADPAKAGVIRLRDGRTIPAKEALWLK